MGAKVFAIGAGKGGVGKTFVATNLAISLAKQNHSVVLIDFDLAGANIHTTLGMTPQKPTVHTFLNGKQSLNNLIHPTEIPHLSMIQGVWEEWEHANCRPGQGLELVESARKLDCQHVIIDLGPGATRTNLEIFQQVDEKILISSPEPTSLEKSYRFLEAWLLSQLSENLKIGSEQIKADLIEFREQKNVGCFSFRHFLQENKGLPLKAFEENSGAPIRLIINSCRNHQDQNLGYSVKSVCKKFFDMEIDYSGFIDFDNAVWHSVRGREPFLIAKPFTALSGQFFSLAKLLSSSENNANVFRAVV